MTLEGLCGALLYAWPGPIYEGNGECQAIIDERADGKQRDAVATVLYGGETNEGSTHWWVYRMMSSTVHPPLFKPIEFEMNIERRTARIVIPGVLETTARPIRSPAAGAEHRVRIGLPNGIEFDRAEIGLQSPSTSRIPTVISPFCASRARGWSADDRTPPFADRGLSCDVASCLLSTDVRQ